MESEGDPRARFRHLPEPVRQEDLVETTDADPLPVVESGTDADYRWLRLAGGGTP